jgi:MSHA biogenesis protein MshJ
MSTMKERFSQWEERFEALSLRERSLVAAGILVLLFLIWDSAFMSPEYLKQKRLVGEMHGLNQQMEDINGQIMALNQKLQGDESRQVVDEIEAMHGTLAGLQQAQEDLTVEFVRPTQMAALLRDMLDAEGGLALRKLESLGASPLFPPKEDEQGVAVERPKIFKHGMRLEVEGDYLSALHYLKSLETMPWRFYWDGIEYEVVKYPKARIVITVHTLSLDEGWIGV